jgi:hypothetical protein
MNYAEDTLACNIVVVAILDPSIMQDGSFVQHNSTIMNTASEWYFIRMKVIEA